jgi:general secretion pathway protein C
MDALLKKHFWIINLVFLAIGAWLLAGGIDGVIAHKLREIPSLSKGMPADGANRPDREQAKDYQVIVDRNYFNSAMSAPVEQVEENEGPEIDDRAGKELIEGDGVPSQLRASLIGTIVADRSEWSLAMITDQTTSETDAYRVDDRLMGEATVIKILPLRVIIDHNGVKEYLELQEEAVAKKTSHQRKPRHASRRRKDSKLGEGIKKVGDDKYEIERGEIEKTLSNLNSIAMQARIVPSFKNGEANGFKLFAIRPGSLYSKIGIQNGDIIHKINGYAMTSPDKALEVYQKLKSARSIEVELTRRGKNEKLHYSIK